MVSAAERDFKAIHAELTRLVRYDDESIVHDVWIKNRYDGGYAASYAPARQAAVRTAWHEAGHVMAALATGARFSSASIRHGSTSQGRVHSIRGTGAMAFVVSAGGQVAERLRDWRVPVDDDELRAWLPTWRADGGDAASFRRAIGPAGDQVAAWRQCEELLTARRPQIRQLARALLVHPRPLTYPVAVSLADLTR